MAGASTNEGKPGVRQRSRLRWGGKKKQNLRGRAERQKPEPASETIHMGGGDQPQFKGGGRTLAGRCRGKAGRGLQGQRTKFFDHFDLARGIKMVRRQAAGGEIQWRGRAFGVLCNPPNKKGDLSKTSLTTGTLDEKERHKEEKE